MTDNHCPDPLCLLDVTPQGFDPTICRKCPKRPKPHNPGWGGRRPGAGAPRGNLNAIKHGRSSKLIQTAVDKLAADPELRAFLLLIARAATTGELPETTKRIITRALASPQREAAAARLRRLRDES